MGEGGDFKSFLNVLKLCICIMMGLWRCLKVALQTSAQKTFAHVKGSEDPLSAGNSQKVNFLEAASFKILTIKAERCS